MYCLAAPVQLGLLGKNALYLEIITKQTGVEIPLPRQYRESPTPLPRYYHRMNEMNEIAMILSSFENRLRAGLV